MPDRTILSSIKSWSVCDDSYFEHSLRRQAEMNSRRSGGVAVSQTRRLRHRSLWIREGGISVSAGHTTRGYAYLYAFRRTLHLLGLPRCFRLCHGIGTVQCRSRSRFASYLLGGGSHPEHFAVRRDTFATPRLNLTSSYWVQRLMVVQSVRES